MGRTHDGSIERMVRRPGSSSASGVGIETSVERIWAKTHPGHGIRSRDSRWHGTRLCYVRRVATDVWGPSEIIEAGVTASLSQVATAKSMGEGSWSGLEPADDYPNDGQAAAKSIRGGRIPGDPVSALCREH